MRREIILLVMGVVVCLGTEVEAGVYGGGAGTEEDPYQIWIAEQMNTIGLHPEDWDKHFVLMDDIDLSDYGGEDGNSPYNPIGYCQTHWDKDPFRGTFNGNGHIISNFIHTAIDFNSVGLFGAIEDTSAEIKDLIIINPKVNVIWSEGDTIPCPNGAGILAGRLFEGCIKNCRIENALLTSDGEIVGLLVGGSSSDAIIKDCFVSGTISGKNGIGGLVGKNWGDIFFSSAEVDVAGYNYIGGLSGENSGYIVACCATGNVATLSTGSCVETGGLVGRNTETIIYSYATGSVDGVMWVGGLVGENYFADIRYCYSTGDVTATYSDVGGLVGLNWQGDINNSYSMCSVTGGNSVGGLIGENNNENTGSVINCYSVPYVGGGPYIGGFTGCDEYGYYEKCFWDTSFTMFIGGIGNTYDSEVYGELTTAMQTASTFIDAGWDFVWPVWTINEGLDYPRLWWEAPEPTYGGGTGEPNDPFLIYTANHLKSINQHLKGRDKHFRLMANIDLSALGPTELHPIGDYLLPFTGVFDGGNFTISNYTYSDNSKGPAGIFGYAGDTNTLIKDLILLEPELNLPDAEKVGSLVGYLINGKVINCSTLGGSVTAYRCVGGLVGLNRSQVVDCHTSCQVSGSGSYIGGLIGGGVTGTSFVVKNCSSSGNVSGTIVVGGLIGDLLGGSILNSYSTSNVTASSDRVGGLVGQNLSGIITSSYSLGSTFTLGEMCGGLVGISGSSYTNSGSIENCYSLASVNGSAQVGGLVGYNYGSIINCFAAGSVTGESIVGGFVGGRDLHDDEISGCFWDIDTSNQTESTGGIGLTTTQMQTQTSFTDYGWDFVGEEINGTNDIWRMCVDGIDYPHLSWEYSINGDFGCPDGVGTGDLLSLSHNWLNSEGVDPDFSYACDPTFDGVTNLADFAVLAENWLNN